MTWGGWHRGRTRRGLFLVQRPPAPLGERSRGANEEPGGGPVEHARAPAQPSPRHLALVVGWRQQHAHLGSPGFTTMLGPHRLLFDNPSPPGILPPSGAARRTPPGETHGRCEKKPSSYSRWTHAAPLPSPDEVRYALGRGAPGAARPWPGNRLARVPRRPPPALTPGARRLVPLRELPGPGHAPGWPCPDRHREHHGSGSTSARLRRSRFGPPRHSASTALAPPRPQHGHFP